MAGDDKSPSITAADYAVFVATLALSAATGFFYAYKDRKESSMDNFHRGKRRANPLAVSLSLSVTIVSALTIMGIPAEVYTYGTMIAWELVGQLIATAFAAHVFLPVFYNMNKISVYEYFQLRFGKIPRVIGSISYFLMYLIIISFSLFAPCLAFQAMTGVSLWIIMAVAAFVCTLYTWLGGMKAVVWADSLQFLVIVAGLICLLVEGSKAVGGFENAWEIANKNSRIQLLEVNPDPRTRHSVWSLGIGYFFIWLNAFAINQAAVQRACSLPSLRTAQLAEWASYPGLFIIIGLAVLNGVVMFAYFENCDPVSEGRVMRKDQLFPLMIVDLLGDLPGLPGLLLACLFSGALSSISSGLNAVSAVVIEDFVKPFLRKPLNERNQIILSKIFVLAIGVITFGIAGGLSQMSGLIHQIINTLASLFGGALVGAFLAGILFPWTNVYGVVAGMIGSLAMTGWLIFAALLEIGPQKPLPVSTAGCPVENSTLTNITDIMTTTMMSATTTPNTVIEANESSTLHEFYKMSYLWYTAYGLAICIIISLIVSFLTGPTKPKDVDSKLMSPMFYNMCPFLPHKYRKVLLFGVDYNEQEKKDPLGPQIQSVYVVNDYIPNKPTGNIITKM